MSHTDTIGGARIAVTGGTAGLGRALVGQFKEAGASVALVARTATEVERVAKETGAVGIVADVGRADDVHPIALQVTGGLGGLDVLINNASDLGPVPLAPLADTTDAAFEAALAVSLLGPFRLTKALLGALAGSAREGRGGLVINISSDAATSAYAGWGAYSASKAALRHMSAIWDEEMSESGVRFLSIDPGDMDTALHAAALPDADRTALRHPAEAAREVIAAIVDAWPRAATVPVEVDG